MWTLVMILLSPASQYQCGTPDVCECYGLSDRMKTNWL